MKRFVACTALLGLVGLTLAGTTIADAADGTGPDVTFVDGLNLVESLHRGVIPSAPIDVYIDSDLVLEAVVYGDIDSVGSLTPGTHNVQLCFNNGAAVDPLPGAGCPFGAVNGNSGTDVDVPDTANISLVGAFGGPASAVPGRPTVLAFVNDVSCVVDADTARVTGAHAAWAADLNVLIDDTQVFGPLAAGENDSEDRAASVSSVAFELTDTTPVASAAAADLAGQVNTIVYVVGNPQQGAPYGTLTQAIDLDVCATAGTTTTTTTTTVPAATPVTVAPAFTG